MTEKKILFTLHGFKVMSDSIYIVTDKPDMNAPTGFQNVGTTKLPSDGVGNTFHAPYHKTSRHDGVWDTGFYELSPCYVGKDPKIVGNIVKDLVKNVVRPYRTAIGSQKALDEHNTEYFDKYNWTVSEGTLYRTSKPEDVVSLYMALLQREVMPLSKKGDSSFAETAYIVIDVEAKTKRSEEKANQEFEAIGMFEYLYKQKKSRLDLILYYIGGKEFTAETSQSAYRSLFKNYITSSPTNIDIFNKLVDKAEKEEGLDELNIYKSIKTRYTKDPKIHKTAAGMIYYEQTELGSTLKNAATAVAKDPSMSAIKKEILFAED